MTRITTHVLDSVSGRPARGLTVRLERIEPGPAAILAEDTTGADGRAGAGLPAGVPPGRYRLVFATGAWFEAAGRTTLFPEVAVAFEVGSDDGHCHLPLLLAPFAYSTYRGA